MPASPSVTINAGDWQDWPAPADQMDRARAFLRDCAASGDPICIVPDKDADGLSSSRVLHDTLVLLGVPKDRIAVHLLARGDNLFTEDGRGRITDTVTKHAATHSAKSVAVIVVDQGSRPGPPFVPSTDALRVRTLVIDHHVSTSWPDEAEYVTACDSHPICTSSLLSYIICCGLKEEVMATCAWPCLIGLFGDLGSQAVRFNQLVSKPDGDAEWPDCEHLRALGAACKTHSKKVLGDAVSAINSPRRTADYDVPGAWRAMLAARSPQALANDSFLRDCRNRVGQEVERCTHTAPKFSKDGRVALFRINSGFQVHPIIATRWAGYLKSNKLVMIACANEGHHPDPDIISFSCRIASSLRKLPQHERPNLQELLREYGAKAAPDFLERVGDDYARGHREATGGIIRKDCFEELCSAMEIGVKSDDVPVKKGKKLETGQKQLTSFFSSPTLGLPLTDATRQAATDAMLDDLA